MLNLKIILSQGEQVELRVCISIGSKVLGAEGRLGRSARLASMGKWSGPALWDTQAVSIIKRKEKFSE